MFIVRSMLKDREGNQHVQCKLKMLGDLILSSNLTSELVWKQKFTPSNQPFHLFHLFVFELTAAVNLVVWLNGNNLNTGHWTGLRVML